MPKLLIFFAVIVWAVGGALFVYVSLPRQRDFVVTSFVPETSVKTNSYTVHIDGEPHQISIPNSYSVLKPVHERKIITPTHDEWLRFCLLMAFGGLLMLYFLIVIVVHGYHAFRGRTLPKAVEIQLAGTITFLMGAISGAIVVPPAALQPESRPTTAFPGYAPPVGTEATGSPVVPSQGVVPAPLGPEVYTPVPAPDVYRPQP